MVKEKAGNWTRVLASLGNMFKVEHFSTVS